MILRTVCKDHVPGKLDPALLKALARGHRWFEEMASERVRSCAEIARREGLQKGYLAADEACVCRTAHCRCGGGGSRAGRFYPANGPYQQIVGSKPVTANVSRSDLYCSGRAMRSKRIAKHYCPGTAFSGAL
jgi:hypothetical protein